MYIICIHLIYVLYIYFRIMCITVYCVLFYIILYMIYHNSNLFLYLQYIFYTIAVGIPNSEITYIAVLMYYLGYIICSHGDIVIIDNAIDDIIGRFHNLLAEFSHCDSGTFINF